ncbi:MAG: helix-turn-helix domain-containing protein [Anaerolineae bacterium]
MGESSQREQRILDAAAELIEHYGYDKTTVDDIAREAGVSKGAIYLHFKSKEALFEALIMRDADTITERFFELIDADPAGVTLFTIYRYALVVLDDAPLLKAIYTSDRRILGDWARHLRDLPAYAQGMNFSVDFIRYFQDAGLLRRDLDPEAVAYLLRALRYGLLTMDDITPKGEAAPSIADMGEALAEMVSRGLAPREDEGDPAAGRQALEQLLERQRQILQKK